MDVSETASIKERAVKKKKTKKAKKRDKVEIKVTPSETEENLRKHAPKAEHLEINVSRKRSASGISHKFFLSALID